MNARGWVGLGVLAVFGLWLLEGLLGLPGVSDPVVAYGQRLTALASAERDTANAVTAVLFDLRALDTLGEALALFAGAAAVQVVLRELHAERDGHEPRDHVEGRRPVPTADAVRVVALGLLAPTLLYGGYIAARGHVSVGGGFQGGAMAAAAIALLYLVGRQATMQELVPEHALDLGESLSIGGFVAVGLVALAVGAGLFGNVLPTGDEGRLLSSGTIAVFSVLIGIEAATALGTVLQLFVAQTVEIREVGS